MLQIACALGKRHNGHIFLRRKLDLFPSAGMLCDDFAGHIPYVKQFDAIASVFWQLQRILGAAAQPSRMM